ncbi:heme exporter protein CcmD [Parasalinivibrio latis]|uniref:heme exporter protein CcmD n=1 Tax=Parasalinivibrio latis TaxID=2952610 RepID=UPI0030E28F1C
MHFNTLTDFFAMGGYAFYVWTSFFITAIAMGWVAAVQIINKKKLLSEVRKRIDREKRIKEAEKLENTL